MRFCTSCCDRCNDQMCTLHTCYVQFCFVFFLFYFVLCVFYLCFVSSVLCGAAAASQFPQSGINEVDLISSVFVALRHNHLYRHQAS